MNEELNKQFEEFQKDLKIREKKLKGLVRFEKDERLDLLLQELKRKDL